MWWRNEEKRSYELKNRFMWMLCFSDRSVVFATDHFEIGQVSIDSVDCRIE